MWKLILKLLRPDWRCEHNSQTCITSWKDETDDLRYGGKNYDINACTLCGKMILVRDDGIGYYHFVPKEMNGMEYVEVEPLNN